MPWNIIIYIYIHLYIHYLYICMYIIAPSIIVKKHTACKSLLQLLLIHTHPPHPPSTEPQERACQRFRYRHLRQFESRTIIRSLKRVNICSRLTAFAAFFLIYSALRAGTTPRAPSTYTQMYVSSSSNQFVLIFVQLWMRTADDAFPFSKMISGREVQEGCKCVCVCGCV